MKKKRKVRQDKENKIGLIALKKKRKSLLIIIY